ncbi:hypothetical protein [Bacteroides oleiciplenus]|uniref:Uncharacterized protein n=1 Tax=Bacteroides oleiciplenus YIT 12058 TaxID=742727 RepID=K9E3P1_9BACE|nr:hypothetical protein [Bacteroides oleiciplenus]EKU90321.1 hypothetical protein HMPREF9447_01739 [Bacteroides oleiciplenus YIT 12058]
MEEKDKKEMAREEEKKEKDVFSRLFIIALQSEIKYKALWQK